MNRVCRAFAVIAAALLAVGCEWAPDAHPEFSPDGKQVAYLATAEPWSGNGRAIAVQDTRKEINRSYPAPEGVKLLGMAWDGKSLIVHLKGKVEGLATSDDDIHSYALLDLDTGAFIAPPSGSPGELANRIAIENQAAILDVAKAPATRKLLAEGVPAHSIFPLGNGMVATLEFPGTEPGRLWKSREQNSMDPISEGRDSVMIRIQFHSRSGEPLGTVDRVSTEADDGLGIMGIAYTRADRAGQRVAMVEPPYHEENKDQWEGEPVRVGIRDIRTGTTLESFDYILHHGSLPYFDGKGLVSASPVEIEGEVWLEFARWSAEGRDAWGAVSTGIVPGEDFEFMSAPNADGTRFVVTVQHEDKATKEKVLDSHVVKVSRSRGVTVLTSATHEGIDEPESAFAAAK